MLCTHSRGLPAALGCQWGSRPGCWPWAAPTRLPAPLQGPSSLLPPGPAADSCSQAFLDTGHVLSASQMSPGAGGPPPLAAVTRFLRSVPAKPLHGAGVGVGVSSTHCPRGHPGLGGQPRGPGPASRGRWAGRQDPGGGSTALSSRGHGSAQGSLPAGRAPECAAPRCPPTPGWG